MVPFRLATCWFGISVVLKGRFSKSHWKQTSTTPPINRLTYHISSVFRQFPENNPLSLLSCFIQGAGESGKSTIVKQMKWVLIICLIISLLNDVNLLHGVGMGKTTADISALTTATWELHSFVELKLLPFRNSKRNSLYFPQMASTFWRDIIAVELSTEINKMEFFFPTLWQ